MSLRTIALSTAIALLTAGSASADQATTDFLAKYCKDGCVVSISPAKFPDGEYVGEFLVAAVEDPLTMDAVGDMTRTKTGLTIYRMVDQPGSPMFFDPNDMSEYMEAQNVQVRTVNAHAGS